MRNLPKLYDEDNRIASVTEFGGLNQKKVIGEGESSYECNMSSSEYPALCSRDKYDVETLDKKPALIFQGSYQKQYLYGGVDNSELTSDYDENLFKNKTIDVSGGFNVGPSTESIVHNYTGKWCKFRKQDGSFYPFSYKILFYQDKTQGAVSEAKYWLKCNRNRKKIKVSMVNQPDSKIRFIGADVNLLQEGMIINMDRLLKCSANQTGDTLTIDEEDTPLMNCGIDVGSECIVGYKKAKVIGFDYNAHNIRFDKTVTSIFQETVVFKSEGMAYYVGPFVESGTNQQGVFYRTFYIYALKYTNGIADGFIPLTPYYTPHNFYTYVYFYESKIDENVDILIYDDEPSSKRGNTGLPLEISNFINPYIVDVSRKFVLCDEGLPLYCWDATENKTEKIEKIIDYEENDFSYLNKNSRYYSVNVMQCYYKYKLYNKYLSLTDCRITPKSHYEITDGMVGDGKKIYYFADVNGYYKPSCEGSDVAANITLKKIEYLKPRIYYYEDILKFRIGDIINITVEDDIISYCFMHLNGLHKITDVGTDNLGNYIEFEISTYGLNDDLLTNYNMYTRENGPKNRIYKITIEKKCPGDVKVMCECDNRLWVNNGNNEILCSVAGDPTIFYNYEGTAMDSWAVSIPGGNEFTGAINYLGSPLFFKDDTLYRISGNRPANYSVTKTSLRGVKVGSKNSLVIINNELYYHSDDGIYKYTGYAPICVSENIDTTEWVDVRAARYKDFYYCSVRVGENRLLYVYDTLKKIWHKESDMNILFLANARNNKKERELMFFCTEEEDSSGNKVYREYSPSHGGNTTESDIEWEYVSGDLFAYDFAYKHIKSILINAEVDDGASFKVYCNYDNKGWSEEFTVDSGKRRFIKHTLNPRTYDNMKIKLKGVGKVYIYGIKYIIENGGDERRG